MIEVKKTETLVCDGCGAKFGTDEVTSYRFQHKVYDGHRNDWSEDHVELCRCCQGHIWDVVNFAVKDMQAGKGQGAKGGRNEYQN